MTQTQLVEYIAEADGSAGKISFLVSGSDPMDALKTAERIVAEHGDAILTITPLATIIEQWQARVAAGANVQAYWKSEDGDTGPMFLRDHTAADADPNVGEGLGMPYGYDPDWQQKLPWMPSQQAYELAGQIGAELV
jgi:hypothetical protein